MAISLAYTKKQATPSSSRALSRQSRVLSFCSAPCTHCCLVKRPQLHSATRAPESPSSCIRGLPKQAEVSKVIRTNKHPVHLWWRFWFSHWAAAHRKVLAPRGLIDTSPTNVVWVPPTSGLVRLWSYPQQQRVSHLHGVRMMSRIGRGPGGEVHGGEEWLFG
jgi:hypothetical protein